MKTMRLGPTPSPAPMLTAVRRAPAAEISRGYEAAERFITAGRPPRGDMREQRRRDSAFCFALAFSQLLCCFAYFSTFSFALRQCHSNWSPARLPPPMT